MVNDSQWLTVHDVADVLHVKVETVRRWIRRGQLSALELGGPRTVYRIRPEDLDHFIWQRYHSFAESQDRPNGSNGSNGANGGSDASPADRHTTWPDAVQVDEQPSTPTPESAPASSPQAEAPEREVDFRRMVEELPAVSYIFNEAPGEVGQVTYISPQIEELLGIPMSEWRHNPQLWLDLMHPEDRERYLQLDMSGQAQFSFDFRWITRDDRVVWLTADAVLVTDDDGEPLYWHGVIFDITEQHQIAEQLEARVRQHEAIARLGRRALEVDEPQLLFDEVVRYMTEALNVEYAKLFELLPGGTELALRASVGWKNGAIGVEAVDSGEVDSTLVSAVEDTQSAYTLSSDEPVISNDLRSETRFDGASMADAYDVTSGVSVLVPGRGRPFGVLGAHSSTRRVFTNDDVYFLQSVANIIAGAVTRADERWLTVQGVADMLQVTEETVRRWIRRGDLPAMNLGGPRAGYRLHPADLHKFIRERISISP